MAKRNGATATTGFRPRVQALDEKIVPAKATPAAPVAGADTVAATVSPAAELVAYGADAGNAPVVRVYTKAGDLKFTIQAYDPGFKGGVRVATGDVTGDGIDDIVTAPGQGMKAQIKVFDGATGNSVAGFTAYGSFRGGAFVAVGDVNGDGRDDIITGADAGGGPHVKAFSGKDVNTTLTSFFAYDPGFTGGVRVAVGDVNGDGKDDIITGSGAGGNGRVRAFDASNLAMIANYNAYTAGTNYGVFVSAGDVNGDGKADIIVGAGMYGGTKVKVFSGVDGTLLRSFRADEGEINAAVRVSVVDYDNDGKDDIVTTVKGTATIWSGATGAKLKSHVARADGTTGGLFAG